MCQLDIHAPLIDGDSFNMIITLNVIYYKFIFLQIKCIIITIRNNRNDVHRKYNQCEP